MQKNTSVTLGSHYENFIAEQVAQGRFGSASEAIRAGLRLLEERETKIALLRQAVIEGEDSGTSDYSLEGFIEELDHAPFVFKRKTNSPTSPLPSGEG